MSSTPVGPVGKQIVREAGERVRARGPAHDHEAPAPAIQVRSAASCAGVRADASTSCHTIRSSAAQAWMRSGRSAGVRGDDRGRGARLAGQELELADELRRVLGHDPDDELGLIVRGDGDLGLGDDRVAADQLHLHVAPEGRRLRVQEIGLARAGRKLDRGAEPGPGVGPAADPELAGHRGPAFSRSTAIANHDPARTWPWRSARAVIAGPSAAAAATLTRPATRRPTGAGRRPRVPARHARRGGCGAAALGLLDLGWDGV